MKRKTIRIVLTPESQNKIFKIIGLMIALCIVGYGIYLAYGYAKEKMTVGNAKFQECNLTLFNQTEILNEVLNKYNETFEKVIYLNNSYNSCTNMLSSKNGNISDMETDLRSYKIDLSNCEKDLDTYEKKYKDCKEDLEDCEDA